MTARRYSPSAERLSASTDGATILYSTDGTNYSTYTGAINVSQTTTLYAKATKAGITPSAVAQATYTIEATPIEPGDGDYVKVTSSDDLTSGEYLIVYEMDGDNGVTAGLAFDGSLETLDAVGNNIEVEISDYTIASSTEVDAATFTIDVTAGTIKSASGKYIYMDADNNGDRNAAGDICPVGWSLPTGGETSSWHFVGDFSDLSTAIGGDGSYDLVSEASYKEWLSYPLNFVHSGERGTDNIYLTDVDWYYWTRTSYGRSLVYILLMESGEYSGLYDFDWLKHAGFPVRCIAGS